MNGPAIKRLDRALKDRWRYWCPSVSDPTGTALRLSEFYATRADYHKMTAKAEKREHVQVKLLLAQIRPADVCVEFGCGGGVVLEAVAERAARAVGIDIAAIGLSKAKERCLDKRNISCIRADVAHAPIRSESADVAYSLEVLEHVWNPETVLAEMVRVLRPGGLLFVSTPNGYSLDLHLKLKWPIRVLNLVGAATVFARSLTTNRVFQNQEPDLATVPSYSDCDMITKIFPRSLVKCLEQNRCRVEKMETFFFQRKKSALAEESERFAALDASPFYRYFGDHILLIARKWGT